MLRGGVPQQRQEAAALVVTVSFMTVRKAEAVHLASLREETHKLGSAVQKQ